VQLLVGEHFIGILNLLFLHAFVVVSQLEFQKLEVILVSDEGVGGEGDVEQEGLRLGLEH
jgi:hypothetical protein